MGRFSGAGATESSGPKVHSAEHRGVVGAGPRESAHAVASAGVGDRPSPKELVRVLGKAKLRGNVKSELRKLIEAGHIKDKTSLARSANERTADWVMKNRVGYWYGEALKLQGARNRIKKGEDLMAPETMLRRVTQSIVDSTGILDYPEVKAQSRALIAAHVRSEFDGQAS